MKDKFNPKVSIIIPVYNGEKYLKEAIDSALNQTYQNIEVIVVNDGSSDDTEKIASLYGKKIRYFYKNNGGVSTALNLGIEKMTGDYFSWLSHDDMYLPNKISTQIEFLLNEKKSEIILYSDYQIINERGELIGDAIKDHKTIEEKPKYGLLRGNVNGITLLIPKEAFNEYGEFDEELRYTQDYDMWTRMSETYKFIHLPEILARTRIHEGQDTNKVAKVIPECEKLWIGMINKITLEEKIKLEGSEYKFYREMQNFLKDLPYKEATLMVERKMLELVENEKKEIINKKVSIIIPFYERLELLIDCLKSAILQTHKNTEIILINDGSKGKNEELDKLILSDKRIKLFSFEKNRGVSVAKNFGITKAVGDYIAFLDSDDLFLQNKIETQLLHMCLNNAVISHTSYIRRSSNSGDILLPVGLISGDVKKEIIYSCQIATPTVMVKREYLLKNKIMFNENYKYAEDICFYLELLKANELYGIDQALSVVNVSSESAAFDKKKQIEGLKNVLNYVLNDNVYKKFDYSIEELICLIGRIYKNEQSDDLSCTINEIYNSKSWRITKPLRLAGKFIRILKKEGIFIALKKTFLKLRSKIKKK